MNVSKKNHLGVVTAFAVVINVISTGTLSAQTKSGKKELDRGAGPALVNAAETATKKNPPTISQLVTEFPAPPQKKKGSVI